jgi:hypothetical protein
VYENSGIGIENAQDCESIIINSEITSNAFGLANAGTAQLDMTVQDGCKNSGWALSNTGDLDDRMSAMIFNNQDRGDAI